MYTWMLLGVTLCLLSCGGGKSQASAQEIAALDQLLRERQFEVNSDWAMPLATNAMNQVMNSGLMPPGNSATRINLIGNANYLRFSGDSVSAYLPYFGERQFGAPINNPTDTGIQFEGLAKDLQVQYNEDKQFYQLNFDASRNNEVFKIILTVYPNKSTLIQVTSTQRFPISYQGNLKDLRPGQ